jgi:DNA invertase Pin-like site-specific DNA recombinase
VAVVNPRCDLRRRPNLGGDVETGTPMESVVFTVTAVLAQMEHDIKKERVGDLVSKRRAAA